MSWISIKPAFTLPVTLWIRRLITLHLILTSILIQQGNASEDGDCNRCVDLDGNSCEDTMRRFAVTKYWIPKDDDPVSFPDAARICNQNGFMVAEITSPGDQARFTDLAEHAGQKQYWIGAMHDGLNLVTPDGIALTWQPPVIYGSYEGGDVAVAIDPTGEWRYTPAAKKSGAVCMFPWNHPCIQDNLEAISGRVGDIGALDDPNNSNCTQPLFQDTQFIRTGPNSKYLMPKDIFYVSHLNAYQACRKLGLEPAVIMTFHDLTYLATDVVQGKQLSRNKLLYKFALGGFDVYKEGVFADTTTNTTLPLQVFNLERRNDYYNELKNCLSLQCEGYPPLCYHASQFCNEPKTSVPLCEYPRDTPCYYNSPLGILESEQEDKIFTVGSTSRRHYFGSTMQKSFSEAKSYCNSFYYELLDFIKDDPDETDDLRTELITTYRNAIGGKRWMGISWTSGYFPDGYGVGNKFKFEDGMEWEYNENEGHFEWLPEIEDGIVKVENPADEKCMLLIGGGSEKSAFYVRPVVCDLPNFFICYEDKPAPTEMPETTPEATEMPTEPTGEKKGRCNGEPVKISFEEGGLTDPEVQELIKDTQKYKFWKEYADGLKIREESSWRVPHVKGMGYLTQKFCADEFVPREYVNLLMNFIMIFYHSANETKLSPISQQFWETMKDMYGKCGEEEEQFEMNNVGDFVRYYKGEDGDEYPIFLEAELLDQQELDYIMDGLWFMHQLVVGVCYKTSESKSKWITDYHLAFRNDFTEVLKDWWTAEKQTNYGMIFGDLDLISSLVNLRSCAQVAFQKAGITDRMFPRPLTLNNYEGLVDNDINVKTGHSLIDV